jgi:hypothetical protein
MAKFAVGDYVFLVYKTLRVPARVEHTYEPDHKGRQFYKVLATAGTADRVVREDHMEHDPLKTMAAISRD